MMQKVVRDLEEFMSGTATIMQLPWLSAIDQDIPAGILSAISGGAGFVVLGRSTGVRGPLVDVPDELATATSRLHEAGFVSTTLTAPFPDLSMLQDAITTAMTATIASGHPLVVVIRQAEALSYATVRRLVALAALRPDGQPVLRFLLAGTSAVWPALRDAGLGHLEDNPAVHFRPTRAAIALPREALPASAMTAIDLPLLLMRPSVRAPVYPPARPASLPSGRSAYGGDTLLFRLRESLAEHVTARLRLILAIIGLTGTGVAAWLILAPGLAGPGDDSSRQNAAAILPSTVLPAALPAALLPAPKPLPVSHDAAGTALAPLGDLMHVTIRYSRGDKAAEARARSLLILLRSDGFLAEEPAPASGIIERSSLAYYFDQDRTAALGLARRLLPGVPQVLRPAISSGSSSGVSLRPPGEISILVGSRNDLDEVPSPSGKLTL